MLALDQDPRLPVPPPSAGASPFDDYVTSPENVRHLELATEVVAWLLDRIGTPGG